jgi:aspartate aminotransferase
MNPPRESSHRDPINPAVRDLGHSATLAINERCQRMLADGCEVIRLGFGQSPFPVPEVVVDELRRQAHQKAYLPVQGLPELRDAVAAYLDRTEGLSYSPKQVLIGPGTKELMFLLQFICEAELVLPSPSWVSYAPQAGITGRPVRWLSDARDIDAGLDPDALDALCAEQPGRTRLLVLNYPNNPTGSTYTAEQLEAIAKVARKHQVLVLSDEIYAGCTLKVNMYRSPGSIRKAQSSATGSANGVVPAAGVWARSFFHRS